MSETSGRGRLTAPPAETALEHLNRPRLAAEAATTAPVMLRAHRAHAVMLAETGIIPRQDAASIVRAVLEIEASPLDPATLDPAVDLFFNLERLLIARVGPELGGTLHVGRSRNDLGAACSRLIGRERGLGLIEAVLGLRAGVLRVAAEHVETVMPGYTHLQPAQPITLGHYLLGFASALERDTLRFEAAWGTTNQSPLGACALAGTGFPIDRGRLAELLGFDAPLENTLDAVASRDWVPEWLAAAAILATNLSRVAGELVIWSTWEFGQVSSSDAYAGTSSIMPQKKNPVALEHCRARAGHVVGQLTAALTILKGTPFGHSMDTGHEVVRTLTPALDETRAVCDLLRGVIETLEVDRARLLARAGEGFAGATELADQLVRRRGLPFRTAHTIVAVAVRLALDTGGPLDADRLDRATQQVTGRPGGLSADEIAEAMDPRRNVAVRAHLGGPAPSAVRASLDRAVERLSLDQARQHDRRDTLAQAEANLRRAGKALNPAASA